MRVSALVIVLALLLPAVPAAGVVSPSPKDPAETLGSAQFPDATTSGLTNPEILTVHEGDMLVQESGAVIENLEIRGTLEIRGADNVTVRNVWIYTSGFWTIRVNDGSAVIEDVEVGSASTPGERGVGGDNITLRRANIHHVEDAIKLGDNSSYDWVYCHDLASPNPQPHFDCVQNDGGASNVRMTRMYLDPTPAPGFDGFSGSGNAALFVKSDLGPIDGVTLMDSYLDAGGYSVFSTDGGYGPPTNVRIINNTFGTGQVWGVLHEETFIPWYGNTWNGGGDVGRDGHAAPPPSSFVDVASTPWATAIGWLNWSGIAAGCATDRFCPTAVTTRAQMASLLVRALPVGSSNVDRFTDDTGSVHEQNINTMAAAGITSGCAADRFCPNAPVTRSQMATFLVNALELAPTAADYFTDDGASVHQANINALAASGITSGCSATSFCPEQLISRGQIAVMLQRSLEF
ncbi:MAG: S-layer homology domain-containing protein [Acidimicrobiia bacterium]|nr:S-layer homology domain-containing protein [Acidimicrobiia bacterium]